MYCVDSIQRNGGTTYFLNIPHLQDAPLLILLHGFPDNAFGWDLQIESLKDSFHIIAPFMPGTLNDELLTDKRITGPELKEDLKNIITKVRKSNEQKIFFISHDLGSFLSVSLFKEMSSDINGLIHINGLGLEQFVSRKWNFTQWTKSYYVLIAQSFVTRFIVSKVLPDYFLQKIYNLSGILTSDNIRHQNDKRVFNTISIYKHLFKDALKTIGKTNHKINTPTLFVWGKDDAFLNIPTLNEVEKFYSHGTVRILNGGHWVMRSKASHVNKILINTLDKWKQVI